MPFRHNFGVSLKEMGKQSATTIKMINHSLAILRLLTITTAKAHLNRLQPSPSDINSPAIDIRHLAEYCYSRVQIGGRATRAAIYNLQVDTPHRACVGVISLSSDNFAAQGVHVGVAAGIRR
jgi:hypothetical protein